jgi:hypothetical protein
MTTYGAGIAQPTGYKTVTDPKTGESKQVPITNQGSGGAIVAMDQPRYEAATGGWRYADRTGLSSDEAQQLAKSGYKAGGAAPQYWSPNQGGGTGAAQDRTAQAAGFANTAAARSAGGAPISPSVASMAAVVGAGGLGPSSGSIDWSKIGDLEMQVLDKKAAESDRGALENALSRGIYGGVLGSVMGYQSGQNQMARAKLLADIMREKDAARRSERELDLREKAIASATAAANSKETWNDLERNLAMNEAMGLSGSGSSGGGTMGVSFSSPKSSTSGTSTRPSGTGSTVKNIATIPEETLLSLKDDYYSRRPGTPLGWLSTQMIKDRLIALGYDPVTWKKKEEQSAAASAFFNPDGSLQ